MNTNQQNDPWCIIQNYFDAEKHLTLEKNFALGNGYITQQANFEEYYSGETTLGSFITEVKLPENEENIKINAPNWTGIIVRLNEDILDLKTWEIINFNQILNMKEGFLERTFEAISQKGHHIEVSVKRFLSLAETEIGAICYTIRSLNFVGRISLMPIIDAELKNQFANLNEPIWNVLQTKTQQNVAHLWTQIRHTKFHICTATSYELFKNNQQITPIPTKIEKEKVVGFSVGADVKAGESIRLHKFVAIFSSVDHPRKDLTELTCMKALEAKQKGWNKLFEAHTAVLEKQWSDLSVNFRNEENGEALNILIYNLFQNIQNTDIKDNK
jgi:maltose phosphorylase